MKKKGFLPQVLGLEIHYFLIGFVVGIVFLVVMIMLGKSGTIPIKLCNLLCAAK